MPSMPERHGMRGCLGRAHAQTLEKGMDFSGCRLCACEL